MVLAQAETGLANRFLFKVCMGGKKTRWNLIVPAVDQKQIPSGLQRLGQAPSPPLRVGKGPAGRPQRPERKTEAAQFGRSPVGTIMGGGRGAMMGGAEGGMGTTLIRGVWMMGGMGAAMTEPGGRRTTEVIGGRGITGTALTTVVRMGGGI